MTERLVNDVESFSPGSGRRTPRADFASDSARLSLNGTWRFTLSDTAAGTGPGFVEPGFDDSGWGDIRVPAHWVLEGHGTPLYTNTAFPIPVDPPRVPTENPTGDYRLAFELPADWTRAGSVLRFQGVDSMGTAWLNGVELGHSKGSRLPFEFEVGGHLRPGTNVLAVRVHRWSSGTYLEDQDMWWLPGIFRDVELLERPAGSIDDFFVHASFDHLTGLGTIRVDADAPGVVDLPELGITGLATGSTLSVAVEPWSAELPRLYRGTLRAGRETIALAVGFRTVEIRDGVFTVNGAPVFMRGVNRHEHDPDRGRSLDTATMRRDILMMKQANINAVRTSHYPPHPAFLDLCDELGLWVVEECDLETHGFIYTGWEGNPPAVAEWKPALLDRMHRMVERDKNHASIVIWSLANESWIGDTFDDLEQYIRTRDPSRPILYERDPSYRDSDFYSLMYPSLDDLEAIGRREEVRPADVSDLEDERRRTLPFLLCEYGHAMGNGPGSLVDYQRILEASDRFCGAFVWEWIDHGFTSRTGDFFIHGGDVDFRPNGGRYCLDGLLFPDRAPSPGYFELKAAIAPIALIPDAVASTLRIDNKHDHRDLSHLAFVWTLEVDGLEVSRGTLAVPPVAPRSSVTVDLPSFATQPSARGEAWLTVTASLAADTPWAAAGHAVAFAQAELPLLQRVEPVETPPPVSTSSTHQGGSTTLALDPATFDRATGRLLTLGALTLDGPRLDVWRAPTENDRGQGPRNTMAATWKAVGLDRMLHRTDSVSLDDGVLTVATRVAPAAHGIALRTVYAWTVVDDALHLTVDVTPEGIWRSTPIGNHDVWLPRLGLRLGLPGGYSDASWFGRGPDETYSDSLAASRVSRFARSVDALQTDYPVPEENGNHVDTRWLELSGPALPTLRVTGDPVFDFTARRWTSEQLESARHPIDLKDSGRVWLNLDHAQQGLGSASCGPAIPARYRVEPAPTRFALTLRAD
jgi:beta-galactosidase